MAITNFIPAIWSETLYNILRSKFIGAANCNHAFEGDIKEMGSVVKICGVGGIVVSDYNKNTDMSIPQTLSDTVVEFPIDRAKYFNFQIDDIDRAQASPKLMEMAMKLAATALASEADRYIYSLHSQVEKRIALTEPKSEYLVEAILEALETIYEAGVSDPSDIVIEVSPAVASILLRAKLELSSDNTVAFENGQISTIFGAKVFVTNSIELIDDTDYVLHNCLIRSKRAIAFADQLSEIEAYRPEKRFCDAVKGLHLYGAKIIYPDEIVCLEIGRAMEQ